jgi:hypothetical protein
MLSIPSAQAVLPGYKLTPPSEADANAALQRVFGAERGTERWTLACRTAGIAAGRVDTAEQLGRVVEALARQGGSTSVVARSLEIRLRTYARLAARTAGGAQ